MLTMTTYASLCIDCILIAIKCESRASRGVQNHCVNIHTHVKTHDCSFWKDAWSVAPNLLPKRPYAVRIPIQWRVTGRLLAIVASRTRLSNTLRCRTQSGHENGQNVEHSRPRTVQHWRQSSQLLHNSLISSSDPNPCGSEAACQEWLH